MSVLLEKRSNGVAVVTLNRPQVLNALDVPAKERLGSIWQEIADDPDVRVAILTGAGEKAFCAGSDIKEINRTGRMVTTETLLHAIPGVGVPLVKPVIAALHGLHRHGHDPGAAPAPCRRTPCWAIPKCGME